MLGLYLLLWFGLQLMQVVALIWLVQVVHVPPNLSTWILLPFQIAALGGLQLWSVLSNRNGRVATLRWGRGFGSPPVCCRCCSTLPDGASGWQLLPLVGLIAMVGIGAATAYLIPWSLLPDAIDADPGKPAGLYTTWMVFGQKLIIGLTMSVFGSLLSLTGYISSQGDCNGALSFIAQPDSALLAIRICMGLLPAILVVLGLVVMRGWPDRGAHLQASAG